MLKFRLHTVHCLAALQRAARRTMHSRYFGLHLTSALLIYISCSLLIDFFLGVSGAYEFNIRKRLFCMIMNIFPLNFGFSGMGRTYRCFWDCKSKAGTYSRSTIHQNHSCNTHGPPQSVNLCSTDVEKPAKRDEHTCAIVFHLEVHRCCLCRICGAS